MSRILVASAKCRWLGVKVPRVSKEEKQRQQSPAGSVPDATHWHEVIDVPNTLKHKVGGAGISADLLRDAEVAVAGMQDDYEIRLAREIDQFDADFEAMRSAGAFDPNRLFTLAHELRGEAGSYGYPLISRAADVLCKLLEKRTALAPADVDIVEAHTRAFRTILDRRIKGHGGPAGERLIDRLEAIVSNAIG